MSRYVTGEHDICQGILLENKRYLTGEHNICQGMLLENMTYVEVCYWRT